MPHPPNNPVTSLYIHVPFCFHKCHYCDFYSLVDTRDRQAPFTDRLIRELTALAPLAQNKPLRTIFIGGGTPSLLRVDLWKRLLDTLQSRFDCSGMTPAGVGEFTVECNPETVTRELLDTLIQGGVNRVSLGAQSFQPGHLKTLERWHNPENVARSIELARAAGIPRQSLDLIYAIPGQTLDDWQHDLDQALSLGTTHLSAYNLTYEPNTAMTARKNRGDFTPADEDLEIAMFEAANDKTRAAGLDRYEVSNYAKVGDEARHNLAYWHQEQWLAAGPSASAHIAGMRWKNAPRLDDYLSRDDDGFAPIVDFEGVDATRAVRETIMTGLRLREGLEIAPLLARMDAATDSRLRRAVEPWRASNHLVEEAGRWRLTESGILLADGIAGEMMRVV